MNHRFFAASKYSQRSGATASEPPRTKVRGFPFNTGGETPHRPAKRSWCWGNWARDVSLSSTLATAIFAAAAGQANAASDPRSLKDGFRQLSELHDKGVIIDENLFDIAIKIVNFSLSLVAVLALLAIVAGAIYYLISLGNDEKMQRAKKIVLYAILGVMVAGISFVIIATIKQVIQ